MAHHADSDSAPRSAMEGKLVVAAITAGIADDVARCRDLRAVGDEAECRAAVVGAEVISREIARSVDADGLCRGGIEARGFRVEDVGVGARSAGERAAGIGGWLIGGG